ncbi:hypothetical protein Tco_0117090 [Tanacetum coccineum]
MLPEAFKMLKTGQRAQSSIGRDPGHIESSETRESPFIQTYFDTHTVDGVFAQNEARVQYVRGDDLAEGSRRQYVDECALHRGPDNGLGSTGKVEGAHSWCGSDDRMSQLLTQLESQHEVGSGSESGGGGDDESGADEDFGRDEDDDRDEES